MTVLLLPALSQFGKGQSENSIEKLFSDGKNYYGGNIAVKPRVPPSGTNEDRGNWGTETCGLFRTYATEEVAFPATSRCFASRITVSAGVFSSEAATRLSH